ncbi:MAG: DUF6478 family protein [Cognatishimia sp.]|uniref:DUF6478 family protein n=1 Tax=Cognatishimia sp. TaxID=2211648 RepID=UPI0040588342
MAAYPGGVFNRIMQRGLNRYWSGTAKHVRDMELGPLKTRRLQARRLRAHLDEVISVADGQLALPVIGSNSFFIPHGTDWSWRPRLWRESLPQKGMVAVESREPLGEEITLFHDCDHSELTLRQLRNTREKDLAPYGLRMDVFGFDGSFLSLVLDMPEAATEGLSRDHVIRMTTIVEMEKPLEIFARLNIKHGPNTEQIIRELPLNKEDISVEFDLAYTKMNEKQFEKAWIDLIFEGPEMNQVILRDLNFSRRLRAEI